MSFDSAKPTIDEIKARWAAFRGLPQELNLPSAPKQFLHYFEEDNMASISSMGMKVSIFRQLTTSASATLRQYWKNS